MEIMETKFKITGKDIDKICESKELKYLFLASFISSDNTTTKEEAERNLEFISSFENALGDSTISNDEKDEIRNYLKKGKEILNADIERFKEEK